MFKKYIRHSTFIHYFICQPLFKTLGRDKSDLWNLTWEDKEHDICICKYCKEKIEHIKKEGWRE